MTTDRLTVAFDTGPLREHVKRDDHDLPDRCCGCVGELCCNCGEAPCSTS